MVLHAHLKKYIFKLGVWLLMYPRRPPHQVWSKTKLFPIFLLPSLNYLKANNFLEPYLPCHNRCSMVASPLLVFPSLGRFWKYIRQCKESEEKMKRKLPYILVPTLDNFLKV